jgi:hypothetical protein
MKIPNENCKIFQTILNRSLSALSVFSPPADETGRVTSVALIFGDRRPAHPEVATLSFDAGLPRVPSGLQSEVECPLLPCVLCEQTSGRDSNELRAVNCPGYRTLQQIDCVRVTLLFESYSTGSSSFAVSGVWAVSIFAGMTG